MDRFPLIDGYRGDALLGTGPSRRLAASTFLAQAKRLATELPAGGCALLLCQDRVAFATGLAALLLRRTTALLPPSHAPHALDAIVAAHAPALALVDGPGSAAAVPQVVVDPWRSTDAASDRFDPPLIDGDHVALVVHTSGTTGTPQPHPKRWSALVRGARALRDRLGFAAGDTLAATVPPQHMWGLEASVMLPLQAGGALHAGSPLLPEEIAATLRELEAPRWLVLTPLHLRALLATRKRLPELRGTLSATMPLGQADAAAFEALASTALVEIYGSTETGVAATRRTALAERFTPLPGIVVREDVRGLRFEGGQIDQAVTLGDHGVVGAGGTFTVQGRDADLVKIGGKRASLAMLEGTLLALPGVRDAAFVILDPAASTPRLAAAVVAPGVSREELLAELRKRIDAVFLPRPLRLVERVPRNALGKVPAAALRDLLHSTTATSERLATPPAQLRVPGSHPSLPGHFPARPIVPAALVLTLVAEACAQRLGVRVSAIRRARFRSPMLPDAEVEVAFDSTAAGEVAFLCSARGERIADGVLAVTAGEEPPG